MKRLFLLFALLGSAAVIWITASQTGLVKSAGSANTKTSSDLIEDRIHLKGIARALDYLHRRRVNPETNEIALSDVMRARKQADLMKAQKSGASLVQWEFMGPNNVGGRTRAILIDPTNPNRMIAGAVSGGLWLSNDGGLNWTEHPQNRELPCLNISCITRAANGVIYAGTGERIWNGVTYGNGDSGFAGCGIYKSTDNGATFTLIDSTKPDTNSDTHRWAYIIALATHPSNPNWVYAATDRSMYMSADGGETWSSPEGLPDLSGSAWDVVAAPTGTIHAVVGTQYFKSTDGMNFVVKSSNDLGKFPAYGNNKKLAVSPTDPNFIYAITIRPNPDYGCLRDVLQSTDAGETWTRIGEGGSDFFEPLGNSLQCQGWYDLCIAVSPADKERIYIGGVDLWYWSRANGWIQAASWFPETPEFPYYVHADKHTLVFHPTNPNILFIGNDGGIARTLNANDDAPAFTTMNRNYNTTQFYAVAATADGRMIGGTQDNGTQFVTFTGDSYLAATEVIGGDGGYVDFSRISPNVAFGAVYLGALFRSSNNGLSFAGGFLDQKIDCDPRVNNVCSGDGNVDGSPEFITPTVLWEDPATGIAVYATGSGDGKVWITLEALNASTVPEWFNIATFSGGGSGRLVTTVNVGRDINGKVMVMAGSADGRVLVARNFIVDENVPDPQVVQPYPSSNVKQITAAQITGGIDVARYVTSVTPDRFSPNALTVTMGNYGRNVYVFRTQNAFVTTPVFASMQGTGANALPPMPVYDLVADKGDPTRYFAATEMGVWMCEIVQTGASTFDYIWSEQNDGIGRVPVFRIRQESIVPSSAQGQEGCYVLYIGTHGKGMYRSTSLTFPFCDVSLPPYGTAVGVDEPKKAELDIQVYPNPLVGNGVMKLTINTPSSNAKVTVYSLDGRLVCRQTVNAQLDSQSIDIAASDYAPGMYVAIFENDRERAAAKFIVK
ncbi:MAG TPA: T9SS type A sorting domain-containing protein [Chitinophagales bacterium]|nr:T9SS type A sorting domain-containing protein [Chitinophagales bacterium]HRK27770.1 T9SS type A sorting domain-containing protein [Chitinophagales bacterium]